MADRSPKNLGRVSRIRYRRLRAPEGDGEVFIDPPRSEHQALIERNLEDAEVRTHLIGGRSIQELAHEARQHLLTAALKHTRRYAEPSWLNAVPNTNRIYLVGHQPTLFHPGVWLKNFVLDGLAKRDGAAAVHIQIDNDVIAEAAIQVPTHTPEAPQLTSIELDRACAAVPWEERTLIDADLFRSAGERIAAALAPFIDDPLALQLWREVDNGLGETETLGGALARLRHQLELKWGLQTLEVPLSELCQSGIFRLFVAFMLSDLPRLHQSHNDALREYRRAHRLRSTSHPVPDLQRHGELYETPFWVWTGMNPYRRKLLARRSGDSIILSDNEHLSRSVPRLTADNAQQCVDAMAELEHESLGSLKFKIRPRALMTTLFLRVFLSDLFIHGIGGAKYDQITDCLIADNFDFCPPSYLTVSGTRLLPIELAERTPQGVSEIESQLREWEFRPEQFIDSSLDEETRERVCALAAQKRALTQPDCELDGRSRHQAISDVNAQLKRHLVGEKEKLLLRRQQFEAELRAATLLRSRELPICLFPEQTLRNWLLDAGGNAS